MDTDVALVGSGPAAEAALAALSDADLAVEGGASAIDSARAAVVVDRIGADAFDRVNELARESSTPWLAVELGGVGGYPVVDVAVAGFDPGRECYDCLRGRVASNVDDESEPVPAPDGPTQRLAGAVAGRRVVAMFEGDQEAAPLGRVIEVPHAERRFLPLPGCGCGGERDHLPRRDDDPVDVETALALAEQGLDDRTGIVQQVGEAHSYPAPYYLAELCDTSGFSDATAPRKAAGVAVDWDSAFMKALGESFERYAAGVYDESDARTAAADDLAAVVEPSRFVAPGEAPDGELEWVLAENLDSGAEHWVPADLVFHPPRSRDIRPAVTTGLGLGSSGVDALLSGLTEVIERDAAMLSWYSTYEPLGLAVEDEGYETLAARARSEGLEATPLLLTQDVDVPVVAVAVHREGERSEPSERASGSEQGERHASREGDWPRFAVGSAADLDPARAARGALEEAVQNWTELRSMGPEQAAEESGAIGEYAEFPEAARAFVDPAQTIPADSVGPDEVPEGGAALDALVDRLSAAGLDAYATRTTTRDLELLGFEAVRVLVPDAQPLFFGDPFFGERAERVPDDLGFEPRLDRDHHPFP
ncbi:YcaO-like family protein [Halomicrobium urmianum]|uniref:YcaO-like family protein n=1 Tax=Halomicrobium urmianum TaxID=1586233 RepID=UPI001CDA152A|nr:YcaO-like family protein [Halomicrobium urmianum]